MRNREEIISKNDDRDQKQNQKNSTVSSKLKPLLGAQVSVKKGYGLLPCDGVIDQVDKWHVHMTPNDGKFTIKKGGWYKQEVLNIERNLRPEMSRKRRK